MPDLQIKIVLPELYEADGKRALVRTLSQRFGSHLFYVVVENTSSAPLHLWAEGNSLGDKSLSFVVTEPGGGRRTIRRIGVLRGKNILRTERLEPGDCQVRAIHYAEADAWGAFPFVPNGRREIALQAVFEQKNPLGAGIGFRRDLWQGRVASASYVVLLDNE